MQLARPWFALDPRLFGRGRIWLLGRLPAQTFEISADLKLFATTFAAGFIVVSILIA
jgi:hypothetical protein